MVLSTELSHSGPFSFCMLLVLCAFGRFNLGGHILSLASVICITLRQSCFQALSSVCLSTPLGLSLLLVLFAADSL